MTAAKFEQAMLRQFGDRVPVAGGVVQIGRRPKCHPEARVAVYYRWRERQVVVCCDLCERPLLELEVKA